MTKKIQYSLFLLAIFGVTAALISSGNAGSGFALSNVIKDEDGPGPARVYVYGGSFEMGGSLRDDFTYSNDVRKQMVNVGDFMMDEHEVTNRDWKEFMAANGNDPALAPDSAIRWADRGYNDPLVKDYFNTDAFLDYPVVGITWEQAQLYCDWRTREYQQINPNAAPFRLPTEKEWEYAAISYGKNTLDEQFETVAEAKIYPWVGDGVRYQEPGFLKNKRHGLLLANFKLFNGVVPGDRTTNPGGNPPTKPVQSYYPNDFYLFDMAGNVNEWVEDHYLHNMEDQNIQESGNPLFGITSLVNEKSRVYKGGSWDDGPHWLNPATRRHFQQDQASSTVGFRTVMSTSPRGKAIFDGPKMPKLNRRKPIRQ